MLLAGESSRAMLASARFCCFYTCHTYCLCMLRDFWWDSYWPENNSLLTRHKLTTGAFWLESCREPKATSSCAARDYNYLDEDSEAAAEAEGCQWISTKIIRNILSPHGYDTLESALGQTLGTSIRENFTFSKLLPELFLFPVFVVFGDSADAYELRYGEKRLRDADRLRIGRDVDNGGLLTACAFNDQVHSLSRSIGLPDPIGPVDIKEITISGFRGCWTVSLELSACRITWQRHLTCTV